jgi:putative oxidoreductase
MKLQIETLRDFYLRVDNLLALFPLALGLLVLRFALAVPFWRSGLTKWDGFLSISTGTSFLFRQEFKLHIFGNAYPYPFPGLMAWAASLGEFLLPALLVLGLFTRVSALGILVMTAIIQLTVPAGWANFHLPWAAMALILVSLGGGTVSFDRFFFGAALPAAADARRVQ